MRGRLKKISADKDPQTDNKYGSDNAGGDVLGTEHTMLIFTRGLSFI